MKNQVKKAVILAGGKGTRFLPATLAIAKEMFTIVDKPILFYHLKECVESGITDVLVIYNESKTEVKKFLFPNENYINELKENGKIEYLNEYLQIREKLNIVLINQKKQNGSGGAVYLAKEWLKGEHFVLFNGDDLFYTDYPVSKQLIDVYNQEHKMCCIMQEVPNEHVNRYGIGKVEKINNNNYFNLKEIVEKPALKDAPSNFAIVGRYLLGPKIFDEIYKLKPKNGEYYLSLALNNCCIKGDVVSTIINGEFCDCGNKLEFAKCFVKYTIKDSELSTEFIEFLKSFVKEL